MHLFCDITPQIVIETTSVLSPAGSGLSTWELIGIWTGVAVLLIVIGVVAVMAYRWTKSKSTSSSSGAESFDNPNYDKSP